MTALSHDPARARPTCQPVTSSESSGPAYRGQRFLDLTLAALALPFVLPVIAVASLAVLLRDGRPVLYVSERMRAPQGRFSCIKLRTMTRTDAGAASAVLGGDRQASVTSLGRLLRRSRIDEFPQLWNVLKGEMGFVGPRPPLERYVRADGGTYTEVLKVRPGVTGLATIIFHAYEERLLAKAKTAAETESAYVTRCIPRKARLDLIYRRNASAILDLYIIYLTAARLLPLPGGRRVRRIRSRARAK
ncbi:sugar transferase [Ostreiculturibacter nitratireducens]|uniref:sugar transferase n=1 Tax=Ostreiculturibacter nitratireducens TaxID=3075226 RepID=UPI0031B5F8AA